MWKVFFVYQGEKIHELCFSCMNSITEQFQYIEGYLDGFAKGRGIPESLVKIEIHRED